MINNDFLKTLTILYVEDEDVARQKLAKILERFFKKVILASNGEEGYKTYQKEMLTNNIDLILSDINMPKMNGIEMLAKIRETNQEIPIIYTTARTESEYLLKAIELNANHYVIKPIDIEDTINKAQHVCEKIYYQSLVKQKNIELEQYSSVLDNVAAVFKLNNEKNISFINSLLLDNFKQKEDEILSKNIQDLFHKDVSPNFINEIFETVKKGSTWQGNIKFTSNDNEAFYLNTTMFQIISDEGFEYVGIGFDSTHDVEEKRKFHKKVIENIKNTNIQNNEINKKIKEHDEVLVKLKNVILKLKEELETEKQRVEKRNNQIKHYEEEALNSDSKLDKIFAAKNKELSDLKELIGSLKRDKTIKSDKILDLEEKLESAHKEITNKEDALKRKEDRIETLKDVINHMESQLKSLNPDIVI